MGDNEFTVYIVDNPPGPRKAPAWSRCSLITNDGRVFVTPAVADMAHGVALMLAGWDGTSVVAHREHLYVPADWLKQERPGCADLVDTIVRRTREIHGVAP